MTIKIAFPTDDGRNISRHFGQAAQFLVLTVEDGQVVARESRMKPAHSHEPAAQVSLGDIAVTQGQGGGGDGHQGMFDLLADCQVLMAGGMGQPAYDRAAALGLEVVLPGEKDIEEALDAYLAGTLQSDMRRVHAHGAGHQH
jgi:predicted Fe-Mo cluster-binding NifX family protein